MRHRSCRLNRCYRHRLLPRPLRIVLPRHSVQTPVQRSAAHLGASPAFAEQLSTSPRSRHSRLLLRLPFQHLPSAGLPLRSRVTTDSATALAPLQCLPPTPPYFSHRMCLNAQMPPADARMLSMRGEGRLLARSSLQTVRASQVCPLDSRRAVGRLSGALHSSQAPHDSRHRFSSRRSSTSTPSCRRSCSARAQT